MCAIRDVGMVSSSSLFALSVHTINLGNPRTRLLMWLSLFPSEMVPVWVHIPFSLPRYPHRFCIVRASVLCAIGLGPAVLYNGALSKFDLDNSLESDTLLLEDMRLHCRYVLFIATYISGTICTNATAALVQPPVLLV